GRAHLVELREDVGLAQDQVLLASDLDLRPAVLRVDDLVADLHVERNQLPVLVVTLADGEHPAALGLLLGRVGKDDATDGDLLLLEDLDDQTVAQGLQIHASRLRLQLLANPSWHSLTSGAKRDHSDSRRAVNSRPWHSSRLSAKSGARPPSAFRRRSS